MISVALCAYNGSKYLSKQLDSILNQVDYVPNEIIICDDKSTDETITILSMYKGQFPEIIKIHQNKKNLGCNLNFKKAISLCSGNYIFLSDQDDLWKNDKIKKTLDYFNNNPQIDCVFTNAELIDENDKVTNQASLFESVSFYESELPKPIDLLSIIALNGNIVTGATLCFKSNWKNSILSCIHQSGIIHDEIIAKKLAFHSKLGYICDKLISYRIHQDQQEGIMSKSELQSKMRLKRIALGLEKPKNTFEYRQLFIKEYKRYKSYLNLDNEIGLDKNDSRQKELILDAKIKCTNTLRNIKNNVPMYLYYQLLDRITNKRQL